MGDMGKIVEAIDDLVEPVVIGREAYVSKEYLQAEKDKLWRSQWLQAGRTEDIPNVGDYITYDIADDSVIIMRSAADKITALHNVCTHRGRKLIDTPAGKRNARGNKTNIICGFHAWTYNLEGKCTFIEHQDDWQGVLTAERTNLGKVAVGEWGGFLWINIDSNAGPLRDYLEPAAAMLDPFQLENMRCRWRKWVIFECNWKVAMEAFCETYHVAGTHPEFMEFGQFRGWGRNQGKHSNIGYDAPKGQEEDAAKLRLGAGEDPRQSTWEMQDFTWKYANTNTTMTLVEAARRLKDELPAGTPAPEVSKHWLSSRAQDRRGARRGLAGGRSAAHRQERHQLADLPQPADRPCGQQHADLPGAALWRRSRQVHLRRRGLRALSRGRSPRDRVGIYRARRTGRRCSSRISRTWPRCRRA